MQNEAGAMLHWVLKLQNKLDSLQDDVSLNKNHRDKINRVTRTCLGYIYKVLQGLNNSPFLFTILLRSPEQNIF